MKKFQQSSFGVIALALAVSACSIDPETRYERAAQSFERSDFDSARLDLVTALKEEPGRADMLLLLGKTQLAMGDGEGALATIAKLEGLGHSADVIIPMKAEAEVLKGQFEKALSLVSGMANAAAYRSAALAHIGSKDADAAKRSLDAGLQADPDNVALLAAYARLLLATDDLSGAAAMAQRALKIDPDAHDPILALAQIAIRQNALSQALKTFDQGLKEHPASLDMLVGKAAVLGDMERLEEAEELITEAIARMPGDARLVYLQAKIAAEKEDWETARDILQAQESEMRQMPHMQVLYAQSLLRLGQVEQARIILGPLISRYPGQRLPRQLLAEARYLGGDAAGAMETMRPIAQRPDATPEELQLAATIAEKLGDPAAAEFRKRARLPDPEWLGGELAKADTALKNESWAKAARSYEAINKRLARPNAMVLNNLAYAKGKLGDVDGAVDIALQAVKLDPENPAILDTAGWLLVDSGRDRARGRQLLAKATRLAPDNQNIAKRYAQALR